MPEAKYKRVLVKLSGEAFADPQHGFGIDPRIVASMARQIAEAQSLGSQLALVIGGGNIVRGLSASAQGTDRTTADYMGMLSTVVNALALQDALEKEGVSTRVDGVYDSDPLVNPDARMFSSLPYIEVLNRGLKVMDSTAISLCMDNDLPIIVFNLLAGNVVRILSGEEVGTLVHSDATGGQ